MNPSFFVLVCGSLMTLPLGQAGAQPAGARSAPRQDRYAAYWLTRQGGGTEYRMLLITRMPLAELPRQMEEQTARALRLLIEEQIKEESKLPLPGGNAPLAERVKACKGALVATLQEVGAPEPGPPGAADYTSRWKVERVLRGDSAKAADLSFRVQSLPEKSREKAPALGTTYILITHEGNAGQIAAILEADEKNLRQVLDLLRR